MDLHSQEEFDTELNRFWRSNLDLLAFVGCAQSGRLMRDVVMRASTAWRVLLTLRDDLRCFRQMDRAYLDRCAGTVHKALRLLSLTGELPLPLLLQGDGEAWGLLADRFGGDAEDVSHDKHRGDNAGDNSKIKLPRNSDVLELCRFLQCRRNNGRSRKDNIREFCRQNGIRDPKVIEGLERQVKRFLHLV